MKAKVIWPIVIAVLAVGATAGFYYFKAHEKQAERKPADIAPADVQKELQKGVEARFRQKQYAPEIYLYKKMLEKYPGSFDLKKKLAFAYFGAAQYDKAGPLLEEVEKGGAADDEVRRELEYIRKGGKN